MNTKKKTTKNKETQIMTLRSIINGIITEQTILYCIIYVL